MILRFFEDSRKFLENTRVVQVRKGHSLSANFFLKITFMSSLIAKHHDRKENNCSLMKAISGFRKSHSMKFGK